MSIKDSKDGKTTYENWFALRDAIYMQAARDWRAAMSKGRKGEAHAIEKFFVSESYGLTKEEGEYILRKMKEKRLDKNWRYIPPDPRILKKK